MDEVKGVSKLSELALWKALGQQPKSKYAALNKIIVSFILSDLSVCHLNKLGSSLPLHLVEKCLTTMLHAIADEAHRVDELIVFLVVDVQESGCVER